MTSKIVVNNIEADAGVSTVTFDSNIQRGTSNLHSTGLNVSDTFLHSTGLNVGTGATIHQPADNVMTLGTNDVERVRIASDGVITAQKSASFGNTSDSFTAVQITSSTSGISELRFGDTTANAGYVKYEHTGNNLIFATNATERLRILSGGQIGMGMDPSSQYFNSLVIGNNDAGDKGITIRSNPSNAGILAFSDSDAATSARYAGYISYLHSDNSMRFHTTAGDERLRITNTGVIETYGGSGGAALRLKNGGDMEFYAANNSDKVTLHCDTNLHLTVGDKLRFANTSGGILRSNGNHALKPTGACIQTKRTYRGSKFTNSSGSYQVVHSHDFTVEQGNKIAIHLDCDMNADNAGSSWQMMGLRIGSTFYSEKIIEHSAGMNMNASANGLTDAMSAGPHAVQFVTRNGGGQCSYNEGNTATGIVLHTYEYVS